LKLTLWSMYLQERLFLIMLGYNDKKFIEEDISFIEKSLNWHALIRKYTPIQVCEDMKKGCVW
jgi:hypothetical protein